jgi:hypothetical protein
MHCITVILTSLISQALLQAALDKKGRDLNGSVFQYEFLKFTSVRDMEKHSVRLMQCHLIVRLATTGTATIAGGIGTGIPGQAYQVGCLATTALACKIKRHRHCERHWHTGCYRTTAGSREASRLPSLAICSRFQCQHPWLFF